MKHDTHTINSRDVPKSVFNQCCKHCLHLSRVVDNTTKSNTEIICVLDNCNDCIVFKTYKGDHTMNHDLHTISLTDNQLELVAFAVQSAFHRAADNNILAELGDVLFLKLLQAHGQESFSDDFDAIDAKIVQPVHKKLRAMAMGEQYT